MDTCDDDDDDAADRSDPTRAKPTRLRVSLFALLPLHPSPLLPLSLSLHTPTPTVRMCGSETKQQQSRHTYAA